MGYCKFMDDLPYIVKILFCLPVIDILWAIYRIVKGICKGHIVTLIAGIIWLFAGTTICWVLDLVFTILHMKVPFSK